MNTKFKAVLSAGALMVSVGAAAPASAAVAVCALTDISPNATACSGFYAGNLLSNNSGDITAQTSALAALGFAWNGNFNAAEKLSGLAGSMTVDFPTLLNGVSYIGIHFGNGVGGPGNATAFYKINANNLDVINLAYKASSNAVLYSTEQRSAVPEPATWALMIVGLGLAGTTMRRRARLSFV